jgi:hypothetical protein
MSLVAKGTVMLRPVVWGLQSWSGTPSWHASPRSVTTIAPVVPTVISGDRSAAARQAVVVEETERPPLWERIVALGESLPADVRARLPRDLAAEHDHYIYGVPKRGE